MTVRTSAAPSPPIVLDSSCWLEFFADTERAELFAAPIGAVEALVVPVVTVYEVAKKLAREAGPEAASRAAALMQRGRVVDVDTGLALDAAVNGLPLADSLIYATTLRAGAVLWTQDAHFDSLPSVRFMPKPEPTAVEPHAGRPVVGTARKQSAVDLVSRKPARRSKPSGDAPSD